VFLVQDFTVLHLLQLDPQLGSTCKLVVEHNKPLISVLSVCVKQHCQLWVADTELTVLVAPVALVVVEEVQGPAVQQELAAPAQQVKEIAAAPMAEALIMVVLVVVAVLDHLALTADLVLAPAVMAEQGYHLI
jgi:hypothetical protein